MSSSASSFRVLVTGGNGFVGRHLVAALIADGHEVFVAGLNERLVGKEEADARQITLDVTNAAQVCSVVAATRPTHLFHLAALAAVSTAQEQVRKIWEVNFGGTLNIALAVSEIAPACRVIHCSSAEIYGDSFRAGLPLDENARLDPVNTYGGSKAAADLLIGQMAKKGLRAIRLRPFNHTGPGQSESFAVPAFAAQIARIERGGQEPVLKVGLLTSQRDFLDVRDVVEGYRRVLLRFDELPPGCAINFATGTSIPIADVLNKLLSLSSKRITILEDPQRVRPIDMPVVVGDASLARRLLGWHPTMALQTTLVSVLDDWRMRFSKSAS